VSGWRDENPSDPLDRRMRATTRLRFLGLLPRVGETTEERERRVDAEYARRGLSYR
jgi:hypothetical protein